MIPRDCKSPYPSSLLTEASVTGLGFFFSGKIRIGEENTRAFLLPAVSVNKGTVSLRLRKMALIKLGPLTISLHPRGILIRD